MSVGFDLDETPIPISDLAGYRVRSEDVDRLATPSAETGGRGGAGDDAGGGLQLPRGMSRRDSSGLFMMTRAGKAGVRPFPLQDPGRTQQVQQTLQRLKETESGGGGSSSESGDHGATGDDTGAQDGEAFITGVYFPLLSVLMPKWLEQLDGNGDGADASQKTVLLVSGVGQPRNEEHRLEDNSTEVSCACSPCRGR